MVSRSKIGLTNAKTDFSKQFPGKLVPVTMQEYPDGLLKPPVSTKTLAYVPNSLPPDIDWDRLRLQLFNLNSDTVAVLGKLNGLHKRVGRASSLLRTVWMREAKLSSEIEDIATTAEELVLAGAGRHIGVRENGLESWNYVRALEHGVHSDLPWSIRVIREMHRLLLANLVEGAEKRPGELRQAGVFIGNRSRGAQHARFVPMPAGEGLENALSDLEKFVNTQHENIPPLFVVALTHYRFATIHPFNDGNGRIGRVLISRSLVKEGLLEHPVVYMSAYINQHKQEPCLSRGTRKAITGSSHTRELTILSTVFESTGSTTAARHRLPSAGRRLSFCARSGNCLRDTWAGLPRAKRQTLS